MATDGAVPENVKPTIDEVVAYARPLIMSFIYKEAGDAPKEQKEEIAQEALIRILEIFPKIQLDDVEHPEAKRMGWKSYVYRHAWGAVKDYLKAGDGFEEASWSIRRKEDHEAVHVSKISQRIGHTNSEGDDLELDAVLGMNGRFSEQAIDIPKIKWDILARIASLDEPLHAFAKHLRGHGFEEIAKVFGLSRVRIKQLIDEFRERFDDPAQAENPWFCQTVWALGLAPRFNIPDCDQSKIFGIPLGQHLKPVDLDDMTPARVWREDQLLLF